MNQIEHAEQRILRNFPVIIVEWELSVNPVQGMFVDAFGGDVIENSSSIDGEAAKDKQ